MLGIVICIVVLGTGAFTYYQNSKSESIMNSFTSMSGTSVTVIRDGKEEQIASVELVVGDVVIVFSGEKVPAEVRIFTSSNLKVDNSSLTGESLPVHIKDECTPTGISDPRFAKNIIFFSTDIKSGTGVGIVFEVGGNTYMGKIADLASSAEGVITTLQHELNHLIFMLAIISISLGIIFIILGIIVKIPAIQNLIFAIGIIVANVPEGLMATCTLSLAIIAMKMYKKNVMVKNLQSVETLGSISCICSDKTGTLTKNKMTVIHLWYDKCIKSCEQDQTPLIVDGEEIPMSIFSTKDESFQFFKFVGICGSSAKWRYITPKDFGPLKKDLNAFLGNRKGVSQDEINTKVTERI